MRFGINFRRDLAKLDDAELASRYELLVAKRLTDFDEAVSILPKSMHWIVAPVGWRGPFHARAFYEVQGFLFYMLSGGAYKVYLTYMQDCELEDLADEIRSRISSKAGGAPP